MRLRIVIDASDIVDRCNLSGIQRVFQHRYSFLHDRAGNVFDLISTYSARLQIGYRLCDSQSTNSGHYWFNRSKNRYRPQSHDLFFALDYHSYIQTAQRRFFASMRNKGIPLVFLVHDALPYTNPEWFAGSTTRRRRHWQKFLRLLSTADLIFTVSQVTANVLSAWFDTNTPQSHPAIRVLRNGADLKQHTSNIAIPPEAKFFCNCLSHTKCFLMVGTLEPRKGHRAVLDAFSQLWSETGARIKLMIVGRKGWSVDELVSRISNHPEAGRRLYWLDNVDDAFLSELYKSSTCLIAASYGEGFGLPIVEAASHGLPVIARDIPVFREVGGDWPTYFNSDDPAELANLIRKWCETNETGGVAKPPPKLPTWEETNNEMLQALLDLHEKSLNRRKGWLDRHRLEPPPANKWA